MVGSVPIGDGAPVAVQSMTVNDTRNIPATLEEIQQLASVGCEIIRLAVVDMEAAEAVGKIRKQSPIPVIADIHFDYHLALKVLEGEWTRFVSTREISGARKKSGLLSTG